MSERFDVCEKGYSGINGTCSECSDGTMSNIDRTLCDKVKENILESCIILLIIAIIILLLFIWFTKYIKSGKENQKKIEMTINDKSSNKTLTNTVKKSILMRRIQIIKYVNVDNNYYRINDKNKESNSDELSLNKSVCNTGNENCKKDDNTCACLTRIVNVLRTYNRWHRQMECKDNVFDNKV